MIDRAINVALLGTATLALAPVVPMHRNLKRITYVVGVVLLVTSAVMFFWPEAKQASPKPQQALFESKGDQELTSDTIEGTGNTPIAKSGGKQRVVDTIVTPHLAFPPPGGELSKISNEDLVVGARKLAHEIWDYEREHPKADVDAKNQYYLDHFAKRVTSYIAEINTRAPGGIQMPYPDRDDVGIGRMTALSGHLIGPQAQSFHGVANLLLWAALQVPQIIRAPK